MEFKSGYLGKINEFNNSSDFNDWIFFLTAYFN